MCQKANLVGRMKKKEAVSINQLELVTMTHYEVTDRPILDPDYRRLPDYVKNSIKNARKRKFAHGKHSRTEA